MRMKLILLFAIAAFCCSTTYAQQQVLFENQEVKFSSQKVDCEIPSQGLYAEYILIQIENKTSSELKLSWFNDTFYNGNCINCDHSSRDRKRTISLSPAEVVTGECAIGLNVGLRVFSKWLRMPNDKVLSSIEITEVSLEKGGQK